MYKFMYMDKIFALQLLSEPHIALKQISFPVQPASIKMKTQEDIRLRPKLHPHGRRNWVFHSAKIVTSNS